MADAPVYFKTKAWVVVKGKESWRTYPSGHAHAGQKIIDAARIIRITANKPTLASDEIACQIEVELCDTWFLNPAPKINIRLPAPVEQDPQVTVSPVVRGRAPSPAADIINQAGS